MSKEQKEFENQKCVCGHRRFTHAGIDGVCYHPDCECMKFELKKDDT